MNFTKGQTIVHPHHGPAKIRKISTRTVQGERRKYYDLEVVESNLRVSVPVDRAEENGLRELISREEIDRLLEVLAEPSEPEIAQWSRRMKDNRDRLRHGDIFTHAAIARDLTRRDQEKRLSFAENQILREARDPLVVEVAIALGISIEKADAKLFAALEQEVPVAA